MGDAPKSHDEHVLFTVPFPENPQVMGMLRQKFPNVKFTWKLTQIRGQNIHTDVDPVPDDLWESTTILATLSALPPRIELAKNIKFIHLFSAGTDHIWKNPIWTQSDVTITTSSGIHGPMISEWVVMQILSNSHRQKDLLSWQRDHHWGDFSQVQQMKDAVGMRFGVLGYGSIGRQAARVCKAMGMDVVAYTASPRKTEESKHDNGYIVPGTGDHEGKLPSAWYSGLDKPSLHDFLSQDLDVILISVPLTKETLHFIGKEEFEILGKKNAFVLNISRGTIIVQDELIKACQKSIKDGGLRGAAIDVTDPEPLQKDDKIWDVENIAVTPHVSGLSAAYHERSLQIFMRNLGNLMQGEHLINVVDRKKGY